MTRSDCFRFALLATTALSAVPALAGDALPTGASVARGSVGISTPSANAMTIRQSSESAIVNWKGFSIGEGASVDIRQPSAGSTMLNRVTGSTPSSIAGRLTANGQVYLINPNGIAITPSGVVRTGAFVASTLGMTDEDFIAGRRELKGGGRSAAVVNRGLIEVGRGGYAALVGGRVENSGIITAPLGRIGLASAEQATLDLSGDGFLQVAVPTATDADDDTPLVSNSGRLSADGGRVEIKAATARQMARQVINLSGVVEARSVSGRSGAIVLGGGDGGRVRVSGKLDASAPRAALEPKLAAITPPPPRPGAGGSITVTGATIELAGATLDASGPAGGGSVRIGGDRLGKGLLPHAATTAIDAASTIAADAIEKGDGGSVVVWSDRRTDFFGEITARGGKSGGDGGSAEVSGPLLALGGDVDLSAPRGKIGDLLLDPADVFIEDIDADAVQPILDDTDTVIGFVWPSSVVANILGDVDLTISTTGTGPSRGDITVGAPLTWDLATTLTLEADNDIIIAQPITALAGGLILDAAGIITTPTTWTDSAGTPQEGGNGAIDVARFVLGAGEWNQVSAELPLFSAADFRNGGEGFAGGTFLRALGGSGTTADPFQITDVYGLQGIDSPALLASSFALANDIDALITRGWSTELDVTGAPVAGGFDPIGAGAGLVVTSPFTGSLDGNGSVVSNLFINRPGQSFVGLFASSIGTIADVGLEGALISGGDFTGGIAGNLGGMIGDAFEGGSIARSFVTGSVSGTGQLGGLIGNIGSRSTVTDSFAETDLNWNGPPTGTVGSFGIGGLVGTNQEGVISRTYANGTIGVSGDGGGQSALAVGGLVGSNSVGTISDSYSNSNIALEVAGMTGTTVGGLVGDTSNGGTISRSLATGAVTGGVGDEGPLTVGGLVGDNLDSPDTVVASYWDIDSSGTDVSAGGLGLAGETLLDATAFMAVAEPEGWDFENTWAPPGPGGEEEGDHYAELYALNPVVRIAADDQTRTYGADNPPLTSTTFGGPTQFLFGPAGDTLTLPVVTPTTDATAASDVGESAIAVGEAPLVVASDGDIDYRVVTTDGTLEVTQAPLTVTADDQAKPYGTDFDLAPTEFTVDPAQLFNGDQVASATIASDGEPDTAGAGTYAIDISAAQGQGLENYSITYVQGAFVVNPASLTLTARDQRKTYGNRFAFAGNEFATGGQLFNGDRVSSATLTSDGAAGTADAGRHRIGIGSARGTGLGNYEITYADGSFTVDRRPLAVPIGDASKTYGDRLALADQQVATGINGDRFRVRRTSRGTDPGASVAGSAYDIDAAGVVGEDAANYDLAFRPGRLTVNPRRLTLRARDQAKRAGEAVSFNGTEFQADGLVNGDTVTSTLLESDGAAASAPPAIDPYVIAISDAEGAGLSSDGVLNYEIAYIPGEMQVIPQQLPQPGPTLTPDPAGDDPNLDAGFRLSPFGGLQNPGDVVQILDTEPIVTVSAAGAGGGGGGSGGGGPIVATAQQVAAADPGTPEAAQQTAQETLTFVSTLSNRLETRVSACNPVPPNSDIFLACARDALSEYASQLDSRVVDLPEPLRRVSAVIRQSASRIESVRADAGRRIAAATSDAEIQAIQREAAAQASAAVQTAVVEIRKAIELIRAEDDPQLASLQSDQGRAITAALQNVQDELIQAVGL